MRDWKHLALPLLILPLLISGCAQVNNIRLVQDQPDDLGSLLENKEFVRARLLTGKYPSIDTMEVQSTINTLESEYEETVYSQARKLENDKDLLGAVQLLTGSLQKLPHSTLLRAMRTDLEKQRTQQVRINERNMLLVRAGYLLEQRELYQQQVKLTPPALSQQREYEAQQAESEKIAGDLVDHAGYAMQQEDNETARICLQLSLRLKSSERAEKILAGLQKQEQAELRSTRQEASSKQARIARIKTRDEATETRQLLEATQQALEQNKLQAARATLAKIPSATSKDSAVVAVQDSLDQVVTSRIKDLMTTGDAQYRAEKIVPALKTWTEALSLDPENPEIRRRIDRANKVLATLEELKRQQPK
jgi:hypothetical protein